MTHEITVDVQRLPHAEGLALPAYQTAHAAGMDLLAAVPDDKPLTMQPGQRALVPTGLMIAVSSPSLKANMARLKPSIGSFGFPDVAQPASKPAAAKARERDLMRAGSMVFILLSGTR